MSCTTTEVHDRKKLYKFTKILCLKVAQVVVQSRQGKKIVNELFRTSDEGPPASSHALQWFNLSIPDVPEVNIDTKRVLNGEVLEALANVLCIEILLRTNDGDEMVLEVWSVKLAPVPSSENNITSVSNIYYRMSIMLKSTLSISRITPAYKLSRLQNRESYKISYKIYGGQPNVDLLGEKHKSIKVSELHTPIGTLQIQVVYRTKMNILPEDHKPIEKNVLQTSDNIMIKSDHFPKESPRKKFSDKKELDLTKPLTAGAFVDTVKMKEIHETLSLQIPPEPPLLWLLAEKDKMDRMRAPQDVWSGFNKMKLDSVEESPEESPEEQTVTKEVADVAGASQSIEVPMAPDSKFNTLMEFPFADGSPITELATFYRECVQARAAARAHSWADVPTDRAALAAQIRRCEEDVPEFDTLVADMCSEAGAQSDR